MAAFRRDIGSRIQPHIEEFAHIIGLAHATPQFEHDVVEAVHRCILGAALPGKRNSALRKDLLEIGTAARAAEKSLGRLRTAYESLSAQNQNTFRQPLSLLAKLALGIATKQDPEFYALSSVARAAELYAAALKGADKGGVRQNIPFRLFVLYLAVAFQSATRSKGEGHLGRRQRLLQRPICKFCRSRPLANEGLARAPRRSRSPTPALLGSVANTYTS